MQSCKLLIHAALQCEAQYFINHYKLTKQNQDNNKYKIYKNDELVVLISRIGKENTINALTYIFENYIFEKCINIGTAGCCDGSVKIGTLFCTNKILPNINFASITTVDEALESDENLDTLLVDMESLYFKEIASKYCKNIFIFKVVSDYLDTTIPNKDFVTGLIKTNFEKIKRYL